MELTREQIEQMPAGRELDTLIAVALYGYKWYKWRGLYTHCGAYYPGNEPSCSVEVEAPPAGSQRHTASDLPYFSTDIAAAWQVVEALKGKDVVRYDVRLDLFHRALTATIYDPYAGKQVAYAEAPTAPLAICRAALLAHLAGGGSTPLKKEGSGHE